MLLENIPLIDATVHTLRHLITFIFRSIVKLLKLV